MIIGGLEKFSLIDYPEHLSAIVFTVGCNFRCQFCYNPMLVWPNTQNKLQNINSLANPPKSEGGKGHPEITEDDLFRFLKGRIGKLDAVVITGGEPTMHNDLPEFIQKIKKMGFKVKLDTNGTNPQVIERLLMEKLINYLAMDIKAPAKKYDLVTGVQPDLAKIEKSITIIKKSGLPYEFRTTVVPELIIKDDIKEMGIMVKGAEKWFLQKFKSDTDLVNKNFEGAATYTDKEMAEMCELAKKYVNYCGLR